MMGTAWARLRRLLERGAARNFLWLALDQMLRLMVGMVVGVWAARHLGPVHFGLLSYAGAAIFVVAGVASLGMDGLVVQKLVDAPEKRGRWIGTAMVFRLATSALLACAVWLAVGILRPEDALTRLLVAVLGVGFVLQSLESGQLDYQARSRMGDLILPRLGVFLLVTLLRVVLLWRGLGVEWFAGLVMFEQAACGFLTLAMVRMELGSGLRLGVDWRDGFELLRRSWPLAIAAAAVGAYMKAGQLMVGELMDGDTLGQYSAGIRIPEIIGFVPMILANSMLPVLARRHREGREAYLQALLQYFRLNFLGILMVSVVLSVGAAPLIRVLYGPPYAGAAAVLAIYAWTLVFVAAGIARSQHLLLENRNSLSLTFTVVGLGLNLAANLALIPRFGAVGAAVATVVSYAGQAFLSSFLFPETRAVGRLQAIALATPWAALRSRHFPR